MSVLDDVTFAIDDIDFSAYMAETDVQASIKKPAAFLGDMSRRIREHARAKRVHLPWIKSKGSFAYRPGEVTLYAGQNGHGKSKVAMQVALSLLGQGQKVCFANFEAKPIMTLMNMVRMFEGINPFGEEFETEEGASLLDQIMSDFVGWANHGLFLYDQSGSVNSGRVVAVCRYAAKELGVQHMFVDNLAKCVDGEDDYNGQKMFVGQLCQVAMDYGVHIHLVHHLKKPPKEADKPDKSDVKGSGAIVDQVDNLLLIWRNKSKEEAMKEGKKDRATDPDQMIYCRKQRNYFGDKDGEPTILLWLDKESGTFVETQGAARPVFANWPHVSSF